MFWPIPKMPEGPQHGSMLTTRPADTRGHAEHGWLDSRHTFSFADYYDPQHMGFRALRVINEDRVAPGKGFGTHPHRDMEILSYVLDGALAHRDSMGTGSIIRPGDVQRMSAGTGVSHSEFNASTSEPVHFLQIWIMPERRGVKPGYEQQTIPPALQDGILKLIASQTGREGSLTIHADVSVYAGRFTAGQRGSVALAAERHAYVHVARGHVRVNGRDLGPGDGAALSREAGVDVEGVADGEVLVFDLA